jgi:MFS family permease
VYYGCTGVLTALWGATLPATDVRLGLGAARLGAVLTALAVGALLAMPVAGRSAERWSGRRVLRWASPTASLALAGPAVAPSFELLAILSFVLGVLLGTVNVALSAHAVAVERSQTRPIMATLHGVWTLGAVAGALAISQGLAFGLSARDLMLVGGVSLASIACVAGFHLSIPGSPRAPSHGADGASRHPALPAKALRPGLLVTLGLIGCAAFVTEGAATDWAGVHAIRVLGAEPATASLVYMVFFAAMTLVRFLGDGLRARLGAPVTVRLAGGTAVIGYGLVLLAGSLTGLPPLGIGCAMTGWALAGAGMAMLWPIVLSTLGSVATASRSLATVTAISYGGGLIGPSVIGSVAAGATLPVALVIPAALALAVSALAPHVLRAVMRPPSVRKDPLEIQSPRA